MNSATDLHKRIAEIRSAEKLRASQGQSSDFQIKIHDIQPVEVVLNNARGYQTQPLDHNINNMNA